MRRFSVRVAVGLVAAATAAAVPHTLHAQGYGVYEQGACAMGRGMAVVASPCADGSSIYFNPAGLAFTPTTASAGGTLIGPRGNFTDRFTGQASDLSKKFYPVPAAYLNYRVRPNVAAGIGVMAPYGLTTDWTPDSAQGRFLGYHSRIAAVYVQPTVAAKFLNDRIAVGAGFDLSFVSVSLKQRLDLAAQQTPTPGVSFANLGVPYGTDFADVNLHGSSTGVGYHVGAMVKVTDQISLGGRYLSRQLVKFNDGTVQIRQINTGLVLPASLPGLPAGTPLDAVLAPQFAGGALTDQSASTYLRIPDQLVVGVAFKPFEQLTLEGDYQYTYWGIFDQLPINFEKLGTHTLVLANQGARTFRVGGEYALNPTSAVRLGYVNNQAASPAQSVIPNLPEGPRGSFSAGFGTNLGQKLHVDLAYMYIQQADRQGRSGDGGLAVPTTAQNNGLYKFHAHLFGASLAYAF